MSNHLQLFPSTFKLSCAIVEQKGSNFIDANCLAYELLEAFPTGVDSVADTHCKVAGSKQLELGHWLVVADRPVHGYVRLGRLAESPTTSKRTTNYLVTELADGTCAVYCFGIAGRYMMVVPGPRVVDGAG